MTKAAVEAFIEALKVKLDSTSDEELAFVLDIGKSTIASWRRRGSIPKAVRTKIHIEHGLDFKRLEQGRLPDDRLSDYLFEAAFFLAIMRLGRHLPEEKLADYAAWLSESHHRVRVLISDGTKLDDIIGNDPQVFTRLFLEVASNVRGSPEQIMALKEEDPLDSLKASTRGFPT